MTVLADTLTILQPSETVAVCSTGCFASGVSQPPQACLERCLAGDPKSASQRGCAMLRRLAVGQIPDEAELPTRCDRGLTVELRRGLDTAEPAVLILTSPAASFKEALVSSTREQFHLQQESEGLAGEVIRCYEQVNLIFDISGQIAVLTDPQDVRRVLLSKLQQFYNAEQALHIDVERDQFMSVLSDGTRFEGRWSDLPANGEHVDAMPPLPYETRAMVARLSATPRVTVGTSDQCNLLEVGHGTSLWGPLYRDSNIWTIVGVVRRGKFFEAGDMMLLDSTLTFAGHLLSNMCLAERLQRASFEAVRTLVNTIDQKDTYTCGHSERVGFLSKSMGKHMGLSHRQQQELEWGGLLHDVGKIGIPEHVLCKPGKLTPEEFAQIKQHPARGFSVLRPVESLQGILDIVLHHHETPDGTGYPTGLKKDEIPLLARIVHVVDIFDALTSTRSYREAFGFQRAVDIMKKEAGPKIDVDVFELFLKTWERLPQENPQEWQRWFARVMEKPV